MALIARHILPVLSIDRIYTAFIRDYGVGFDFPGEYHDMWELGCVRRGRASITSGAEVYNCEENELVIHRGGTFHNVWANGAMGFSILTVSFTGSGVDRFVPAGKFVLNESERALMSLIEAEIESVIGESKVKVHNRENGQMLKNLLEALFLSLYRRKGESEAPVADRTAKRFAEIAGYLEKSVDLALTSSTICRECAIGKTALKELFREYTGMGVMQYYNGLRVRRAAGLIEDGCSMAQIAEIMHFSSQNYFSAFFRRETGCPPNRYLRLRDGV